MSEKYSIINTSRFGTVIVPEPFPVERLALLGKVTKSTGIHKSLELVELAIKFDTVECIPKTCLISKKDRKKSPDEYVKSHKRMFETSWKCIEQMNDPTKRFGTKPEPLNLEKSVDSANAVLTKSDEMNYIRTHLNDYAKTLGLQPVRLDLSNDELNVLAAKGDALVRLLIIYSTHNGSYTGTLASNLNMRLAMIKLGFIEFTNVNDHLAGTFFEALYFLASDQSNTEVLSRLNTALIGDMKIKKPNLY